MKRILLVFVLTVLFLSCKNDNKEDKIPNTKVEEVISVNKNLTINLTAQYLLNDNIWMFYTEDFMTYKYEMKNVMQKSVKGKEGFQTISFELPNDIYPEGIKFLFSNNKDQNYITIERLTIQSDNKEFTIDSSNFENFFNYSKFVKSAEGGRLELIEVDGIYDPNIVSTSQLNNEIVKF